MPCFAREKSLSFCPRRDKGADFEKLSPNPVRPRAIRYHGLFGYSNAEQHLIVDDNWSPSSLTEQFANIVDMLNHRKIYKAHEAKADRKRQIREKEHLRSVCIDGRMKLKNISFGNNALAIRNILSSHRDMQRLYQRMPIHLIVDNITQRTFILRKERDRLNFRLTQRKDEFKVLLLKRAELENRIRYANEFILEDELHSRKLKKKIENSNVRIKAIRAINSTYQKVIQILLQDEIFYEPILRSLDHDMEDQSNFINYILYLGKPAIAKFRELNIEFRQLQEKSRKNLQSKIEMLNTLLRPSVRATLVRKDVLPMSTNPKHYIRDTHSMFILKIRLAAIEKVIKELKFVTLCSQAREIYPSIMGQMENNKHIRHQIELQVLRREHIERKQKQALTLEEALLNNLSEEEMNRLDRISDLKVLMEKEEDFEKNTIAYIRNRSDAYVTFRLCLWNIMDVVDHFDHQAKASRSVYPNSYLKLPLLRFEMLNMIAAPPGLYEEDPDKIMAVLKRKVFKLMRAFNPKMEASIKDCREKYHIQFLEVFNSSDTYDGEQQEVKNMDDDIMESKTLNVPTNKQIKAQSVKVLENVKREEEM